METEKDNKVRKLLKFNIPVWAYIVPVLVVVIIIVGISIGTDHTSEAQITTSSVLEKIESISELSTYEVLYQGVATVNNEKKPNKVDFYVYYEANVKAGLNLDEVQASIDEKEERVLVTLPELVITSLDVEFGSLDYMFVNDKADESGVTERAYNACIDDLSKDISSQSAVCDLARQNAEDIIYAWMTPFINQLEGDYKLVIEWEGQV